jgi:glycosyltransferase involved in cell wall biosynthesis
MTLSEQHDVTVITDVTRREQVERYPASSIPPSLKIMYFRPLLLTRFPLNGWTAQLVYSIWQYMLYPYAARLHRKEQFDIAIHVTYGVFRHPSFLGLLRIPFLFGPLGGGEDAAWALKRSIRGRERIKEGVRAALNVLAKINPALWVSYASATLILVKTRETRRALPFPYRARTIIHREIGIHAPTGIAPRERGPGDALEVLFVGRLLGWKGAHLAVRAVAMAIQEGTDCRLTIVGRGPYRAELERAIDSANARKAIRLIDHLPQQDLFALYRAAHCFLFPSLHDSSGNVVLEAQAYGLPVVCLDLGGPPTLVTPESAFVLTVKGKTERDVIGDLSDALRRIASDEPARLAMATAALEHSRRMTWHSCVYDALRLLDSHLASMRTPGKSSHQSPGIRK